MYVRIRSLRLHAPPRSEELQMSQESHVTACNDGSQCITHTHRLCELVVSSDNFSLMLVQGTMNFATKLWVSLDCVHEALEAYFEATVITFSIYAIMPLMIAQIHIECSSKDSGVMILVPGF